jgi:hypothetical protein
MLKNFKIINPLINNNNLLNYTNSKRNSIFATFLTHFIDEKLYIESSIPIYISDFFNINNLLDFIIFINACFALIFFIMVLIFFLIFKYYLVWVVFFVLPVYIKKEIIISLSILVKSNNIDKIDLKNISKFLYVYKLIIKFTIFIFIIFVFIYFKCIINLHFLIFFTDSLLSFNFIFDGLDIIIDYNYHDFKKI